MKRTNCLISAIALLLSCSCYVGAYTLTFDDIPDGVTAAKYYSDLYNTSLDGSFIVVDHADSTWGKPNSGKNVLMWPLTMESGHWPCIGVAYDHPPIGYASSIGGHFSTEPGAILQIIGYHSSLWEKPLVTATIGASDKAWENNYVEISSKEGIGMVKFVSVTPYAVNHFCVDDLTVNPVPEPASILGLLTGLAGIGGIAWRKR